MSSQSIDEIKPFISLLIIIITLFSVVFFKMNTRLLSYSVLKQSRNLSQLQDRKRALSVQLAKMMQPKKVRSLALSRLALKEVDGSQVVYMTGQEGDLRY